jgi:predicted porin
MKKISLLPLVAALAVAGTAQAQNVTVYGQLDAMFTEFTNDDSRTQLDEGARSRLGFRGEDKLNNGMTAYFQLEERFFLDTNAQDTTTRWKDKAWVGLRGGFGDISVGGAIPTALDVIYGGSKAANQDTIADVRSRRAKADTRIVNGVLYKSPRLGPAQFYAATALKESAAFEGPAHISFATNINLGPNAYLEAGYAQDSRHSVPPHGAAVSNGNMFRTVLVNGGFKLSPNMEIIAAVADSQGYAKDGFGDEDPEMRVIALGLKTKAMGGNLTVTLTNVTETNTAGVELEDINKLGVALGIPLGSRTEWLSAFSYETQDLGFSGEDSRIGVQTGLRLKF